MYKKIALTIILTMLVIVGCGTSETKKVNNDLDSEISNNEQAKDSEVNKDKDEANKNDEKKQNDDQAVNKNDDEKGKADREVSSNNEITYELNGEKIKQVAEPQHNDNQNYTMNVLADYTFTAEEPYNDIVYLTDDSNIFMRIQLLDSETDWDFLTNNTKEQLLAVANNVETSTAPATSPFKDATVIQAKLDNELVTAYLIKNNDVQLKLTLFTKTDKDHTDPFLKMAKTIVRD